MKMSLQRIVTPPHKVLRGKARDLSLEEISSAKIQRFISDMKATLAAAPDGVGLAAPQVGELLRIFLVSEEAKVMDQRRGGTTDSDTNMRMHTNDTDNDKDKKKWEHSVFINPRLVKKSQKKIEMVEGCLSVPQRFGVVPRAEKVMLAWLDEHGRKHTRGFTGFFARVIQHEMDHLEGVLITDRAKKLFKAADDK